MDDSTPETISSKERQAFDIASDAWRTHRTSASRQEIDQIGSKAAAAAGDDPVQQMLFGARVGYMWKKLCDLDRRSSMELLEMALDGGAYPKPQLATLLLNERKASTSQPPAPVRTTPIE